MKVLVACEESQAVCKAFRELGHEAYSCDIQECSGGHPEWHIQDDVLKVINPKHSKCKNMETGEIFDWMRVEFRTCDGIAHCFDGKWDLIIAHPPCTYLSVSGNRWFDVDRYGQKAIDRQRERERAAEFFMKFVNADCEHIAIENPIGYMSTHFRKPSQIIQPWMFGDNHSKSTCLWLLGLPALVPEVKDKPELEWYEWDDAKTGRHKRQPLWYYKAFANAKTQKERARLRSKTFPGIARAMAEQWGGICNGME